MLQSTVFADHEALSRAAAALLAERLRQRPDALLCLATGATPMRTYELLAERQATEPVLFEGVRVIKLDEWGGLALDDPASCEQYLQQALIGPLGLSERYVAFDGQSPDSMAECRRIARWLEEHGPIDTCVLGLGVNGHLGFNEPAPSLRPHAHVAELSAASLQHSMLDAARSRPTHGLTLGMADLLHADCVLLLVSGAAKREPLARLMTGPISTEFPASLLAIHRNALVLCDTAAWPKPLAAD
jgi:galactosamine-6-phosphate isomerase